MPILAFLCLCEKLYKELKVSDLQANVQIIQKGESWTWNQRFNRGLGSILTGGNIFCYWNVLFSCSKASDANIIANFVYLSKNLNDQRKERMHSSRMHTAYCSNRH